MIGNNTVKEFFCTNDLFEPVEFAYWGNGVYAFNILTEDETDSCLIKLTLLPAEGKAWGRWVSDDDEIERTANGFFSTTKIREEYGNEAVLCAGIKLEAFKKCQGTLTHTIYFNTIPELQFQFDPTLKVALVFGEKERSDGTKKPCLALYDTGRDFEQRWHNAETQKDDCDSNAEWIALALGEGECDNPDRNMYNVSKKAINELIAEFAYAAL